MGEGGVLAALPSELHTAADNLADRHKGADIIEDGWRDAHRYCPAMLAEVEPASQGNEGCDVALSGARDRVFLALTGSLNL